MTMRVRTRSTGVAFVIAALAAASASAQSAKRAVPDAVQVTVAV